jgi:spermidine synthase
MTLGAVVRYPIKSVDVVEIEPAVVEAGRYFKDFTGDALNDPRVNLIVGDGRNHLTFTNRQYDVIISEPSNPWVSGMANLFSREFFKLAKERLRKEGVMCQWVHAYSMSSVDFKTIVRTFHTAFPHVTVWEASIGGNYLLMGSQQDLNIDYHMLVDRLGDDSLRADHRRMNITNPASFFSKLLMSEAAIPVYTKDAPLHTDANVRLEYSAPKALLKGQTIQLLAELYQHRQNPASMLRSLQWVEIPTALENDLFQRFDARKEVLRGFISYYSNRSEPETIKRFEKALNINPEDYDATHMLAKLNYEMGDSFENAQRVGEATRAYEKSTEAIENFIRVEGAFLSDYFALDMIYANANLALGTMALRANHLEQAAEALNKSLSGEMRSAKAHNNLGIVYERSGKYDAAVNQYQLAIDLDPKLVSAHMNMGNTRLKQEKYPEAIASYHQVQELKPDFAITNYNLGMAYFRQNQWEKAEAEWMRALELKPDLTQAQQGLEVVRKKVRSQ